MNSQLIQLHIKKTLNYSMSEKQANLLLAHFMYLKEQNTKVNLTRIQDENGALVLHIEDSLSVLPELDTAPKGPLVDLGSGGGYPGIPLAVISLRPCTLVEATKKKAQVLQTFIEENALEEQVKIEAKRIEEVSRLQRAQFAVATARALSSLSSLMELAAPLLQNKGILLAYKGRLEEQELQDARSLEQDLGMHIVGLRPFVLSDGASVRTIVKIEKAGPAKHSLPRRDGQAQHHPLKGTPPSRN